MRILVTGGSGYLGGRLIEYLEQDIRYTLRIASRSYDCRNQFKEDHNFIKLDWSNNNDLLRATENIDIVVHLSGTNANDSMNDPELAMRVNSVLTKELCNASVKNNVKKFIYFSTAHVYRSPLEGHIDENTTIENPHPYAHTHFLGEEAVIDESKNHSIKPIIFRLSNTFGAPKSKNANCWMLLLNDLSVQAVSKGKLIIKSSGKQRRDFIPMIDVLKAVQHFIDLPDEDVLDIIYNLGGRWSPTIEEITRLFVERYSLITGINLPIIFDQSTTEGDDINLNYDTRRIENTGFKVSGKDAVKEEIDRLIHFSINHVR